MSIKDCFVSRYRGGYLVEVDFSQLEVVALAILSKDKQLISDINNGLDMHRVRAAKLFGKEEWEVTQKERQLAKQLSFQLQYGAGAKSMAEKNEVSVDTAKEFIRQYYMRYPQVELWQAEVLAEVQRNRQPSSHRTAKGYPAGIGHHYSPTGRIYTFREYDSYVEGATDFSPTEVKNYPVQGFATGDIMALFRGKVMRSGGVAILSVNTVHDSIMFDVPDTRCVVEVSDLCRRVARELPATIKELWDIIVPVEFKVECKYGPTWASMSKLGEDDA